MPEGWSADAGEQCIIAVEINGIKLHIGRQK